MARSFPRAALATPRSSPVTASKWSVRSAAGGQESSMNAPQDAVIAHTDPLVIAGRPYRSRLLVGTGKYKDFAETRSAIVASGAEIVTIAIRRTNIGQNPDEPSLLDHLPPSEFTLLPNTAGCYSAEEAIRTLKLARELLDGHRLVQLQVPGGPHSVFSYIRGVRCARR